jgi:hypothetical protein
VTLGIKDMSGAALESGLRSDHGKIESKERKRIKWAGWLIGR